MSKNKKKPSKVRLYDPLNKDVSMVIKFHGGQLTYTRVEKVSTLIHTLDVNPATPNL